MASTAGSSGRIRVLHEDKCGIWSQSFELCDRPVPVGRKGLQTLIHFSDVRKDEALHHLQADKGEATHMDKILVNGACRKSYSDGRKYEVEFLEETPPPKWLLSSPRPFHWKTDCLSCGKEAIIDRKHPERDVIMYVRTVSIRKTISAQVAVGAIHGPLRSSLASRIVSSWCQKRPYIIVLVTWSSCVLLLRPQSLWGNLLTTE